MPITYTGRLVRRDGEIGPSLVDIAVGLSRQPRFAGQTRRWWSVLDHTLFCDAMVTEEHAVAPFRRLRRAILLHDAHEAITADVPTDYKTDDLRTVQDELDHGIFARFGVPGALEPLVKDYDHRALLAEARVVGPPETAQHDFNMLFGAPKPEDLALLTRLMAPAFGAGAFRLGLPPREREQESHPAVLEFLDRMMLLL